MTDNKQKLDIVQRIAAAISRTDEATSLILGEVDPAADTIIGEVPLHLRHLHNLLADIGKEVREAEVQLMEAKKRHGAVHTLFFDAVEHHVPCSDEEYDGVKLCKGWQVVGYKRRVTGDDVIMGSLGELFAAAMTGRG